jgi:hypothetical protein
MLKKLDNIAKKYHKNATIITTEEATKNTLIIPFFTALGFDFSEPSEFSPEVFASIGEEKRERIDYALKSGDEYLMLVECKKCKDNLGKNAFNQLSDYFKALRPKLNVRIGILTNGLTYKFFSDLDEDNVLDSIPFFHFNILNFDEQKASELKQFEKSTFDINSIIANAREAKLLAAVKEILGGYLVDPPEKFSHFVLSKVFPNLLGRRPQELVSTFKRIISEAFNQLILDRVNGKLEQATSQNVSIDSGPETEKAPQAAPVAGDDGIAATINKIEALAIVKTILRSKGVINRIYLKDYKDSSSILLDNKQQKILIKLYFNDTTKKRIVLGNDKANKKGNQVEIKDVYEICKYSNEIIQALNYHLTNTSK